MNTDTTSHEPPRLQDPSIGINLDKCPWQSENGIHQTAATMFGDYSAVQEDAAGSAEVDHTTREPLAVSLLKSETDFYSSYPWCLNSLPILRNVAEYLSEELGKLDSTQAQWHRDEVVTNVFLLSCMITDTVDDYLAGTTYDFSKLMKVAPFINPAVRVFSMLSRLHGRVRLMALARIVTWRNIWASAVSEFLRHTVVSGPSQAALIAQRDRLVRLLPPEFPRALWNRRPKTPAFFRSRDFAPNDCLELARRLIARVSCLDRPIIVVGLRTAGSYLAPLLCAYISWRIEDASWTAIRPGKGLMVTERALLQRAAKKKARAVIIDESIHSGQTIAKTVDLLRREGVPEEDIVVLNPAEPALPAWKTTNTFQCFSRIGLITLEPAERFKERLLDSEVAVTRIREYFKARGYVTADIVKSTDTEQLNSKWRSEPPERVDVRLKRIYKVQLKTPDGLREVRYVLGKSVGWGWLGYHALLAGQQLAEFVPPILGLRDGILYSEWLLQEPSHPVGGLNREALINSVGAYVAARARKLCFAADPVPDLALEGRHKGCELLAYGLSRAYSSRIAAAIKRAQLQRELSRQNRFAAVMTDSKMSIEEWISAGSRIMKCDFEHHCQGKNELGMTDPAFDLASAMFNLELSELESTQLVRKYVSESGDTHVEDRLFFHKFLAGMCGRNLAVLGLEHPRLAAQRDMFSKHYISAWNFLIGEAIRECGRLCRRPEGIHWQTPLVMMDIDGVLDRMVFGFPCTTAAGIKAISLLHSHGFPVAANTARTLREVKQYAQCYGFVGGVAEYGSVIWDAISDREQVLVSPESLLQLEEARAALRRIPGCYLNDDYRYSIRAFSYQNGQTIPLPPLLAQDLLSSLRLDRLRLHQTGLDTAIVARETDKGVGSASLLEFAGLLNAEVLAIGDSAPDLPMFRAASRAFAPGNVSCRREAELLGCYVAKAVYQPGLLEIARRIVHPAGDSCDICRAVEEEWSRKEGLFVSLLCAADQKPTSLLVRNLMNLDILEVFRKSSVH